MKKRDEMDDDYAEVGNHRSETRKQLLTIFFGLLFAALLTPVYMVFNSLAIA